jgi:hypothetical protein
MRDLWAPVGRQVLAEVEAVEDPAARAIAAAQELERLNDQVQLLSAVRVGAVGVLRAQGLSLAQLARLLGVSKARAAQLAQDAARRPGS